MCLCSHGSCSNLIKLHKNNGIHAFNSLQHINSTVFDSLLFSVCVYIYHIFTYRHCVCKHTHKHTQHEQSLQWYHPLPCTHAKHQAPLRSVLSVGTSVVSLLRKKEEGGKKTRRQSLLKSPFPLFCKRILTRVEEERWWEQEEMAPNWLHEEEEDKAKEASW